MQRVRRRRPSEHNVMGERYDVSRDRQPLPEPQEMTSSQIESLRRKVQTTAFMRRVGDDRLTMALRNMTLRKFKAGEIVFRQDDLGDHFYIVEEGVFERFERDDYEEDELGTVTKTFNAQICCIDEIMLLFQLERNGTLRAATDGKLWEIHRRLYTIILRKMCYLQRQRWMLYLNSLNVLAVLSSRSMRKCIDAVHSAKHEEGEEIMKEGSLADRVFFIEDGEAELVEKSGERRILKRGDCFGGMALLTRSPRDATVVTLTECQIGYLESDAMERMIGKLRPQWRREPRRFRKLCNLEFGTETPDESIFR